MKSSDELSVKQQGGLPEGWHWECYEDGSGRLCHESEKQSFFSYDCVPYHSSGGIEYKESKEKAYSIFWGSLKEFKSYAENVVRTWQTEKGIEEVAGKQEVKENVSLRFKGKSR